MSSHPHFLSRARRAAAISLGGLLVLMGLAAAAPMVAAAQDPLVSDLQARLDAYRSASGFPGAVLGLAFADGRVLALATGMSDTARRLPMRPEDRLLMGSVGKTYVAATALRLVRDGWLDLDAPVSRYVGGQGWFDSLPNAGAITVRQLMNHSSGLVRYEFRPEFTAALTSQPDKVWDPREQIRYLHGTTAPFAAGAGWDYSDTNYLVLALVLESILGRPIDVDIQARILGPHQLFATIPSDSRTLDGVVQGYAGRENPFGGRDAMIDRGQMIINPQFEGAGGGYAASAADAARWGALFFGGRLFGEAVFAQSVSGPAAPMLGRNTRYGLGIILRDSTAAGPVRGHSGFFPGYVTELRHYPERGMTLALMVNASNVRMQPSMGRWLDEQAARVGTVVSAAAPSPGVPAFTLQRVAEGVYVTAFAEPRDIGSNGNGVVIINDTDVLVVDTQGAPSTAVAVIQEIRKLTPKPVRYVVNTHFHGDHIFGNQAYAAAFPGVQFIGHSGTREDITKEEVPALDTWVRTGLPKQISDREAFLAAGKTRSGADLTDVQRASLRRAIDADRWTLAELQSVRPVLPTLIVDDSLVLHRGDRTIVIRHHGRGNTRGDLTVYLPRERILITGDLLVQPMPYAVNAYIGDWIRVMHTLRALNADVIVPGHGEVQHDKRYFDLVTTLLETTMSDVRRAVGRGLDLEATRQAVVLDSLRARFTQPPRFPVFDGNYTTSAIERAWLEARGELRVP